MMLHILCIIVVGQISQSLAAKALTLAIVSTSASAWVVHHPFPYKNWQNWRVFQLFSSSFRVFPLWKRMFRHTHISSSEVTAMENIWTHPWSFSHVSPDSNLLIAAVRLNATSQVCRNCFHPPVFCRSSPFPAGLMMLDDVWWLIPMKTDNKAPWTIYDSIEDCDWHFLTEGHKKN